MNGGGRWAVYYAPPEAHPLWHMACTWLGRDAISGRRFAPPGFIDTDAWEAAIRDPRRYGFHATLKAPMRLGDGATQARLEDTLRRIARRHRPFDLPLLSVQRLGQFLALRPTAPCAPLQSLAADCVVECDPLRAPPSNTERARRLEQPLNARQRELLARWGYPYVLDQYRFHLTLTAKLAESSLERLQPVLTERFAPAVESPLTVADITLWHEEEPGGEFRLLQRFALG